MKNIEQLEVLWEIEPKTEESKTKKRKWGKFLIIILLLVIIIILIQFVVEYFSKPTMKPIGELYFKVKVINENPYPITVYVTIYIGENHTPVYWSEKHIESNNDYIFNTPFFVKEFDSNGIREVEVGIIMNNMVMNSRSAVFDESSYWYLKDTLTVYIYGIGIDFEYYSM